MTRTYRIGHQYRDAGKKGAGDEFMDWLNTKIPDSKQEVGIGNAGGIRTKRYTSEKFQKDLDGLPAALILTTTQFSQKHHNPWEDIVDYTTGQISYWGDAKFKERTKMHNDFKGNRILEKIHDAVLLKKHDSIPPILHFTRTKRGYVQFSGLCVLEKLEITWYEDKGHPIKNFRARLAILDAEELPLDWIHARASSNDSKKKDLLAPIAWKNYLKGNTQKLFLWKKLIRSTVDQIPIPGSDDSKILDQVYKLSPEEFERFCTALMQELSRESGIQHNIEATRLVKDGGLDFFGKLIFPSPLHYEISFKGQAKRYETKNPVGPTDISRLVARLQRGEYGIFMTTSYYTKTAQEEILEDNYPIRLFSGSDIVLFLRVLGLVSGKSKIHPEWLSNAVMTPCN